MLWKNLKVFLVVLALLIALPLGLAVQNGNETNNENNTNDDGVDDEVNGDVDDDASDEVEDENSELENDVDEEAEEESDDVEEVEKSVHENVVFASFKTNHGAQVRLLQLERSIQRNILQGELLLERLADRLDNESLEDLEAILVALEDLKEEVSSYEFQGQEEDVRAFVDFRHQANALTKEFRETLRGFVQENERNNLRAQLNREIRASPAIERFNNALRERARAHNEEVVRESINASGVIDEGLLNRIRSGDIDPKEIKGEVLKAVKNARGEQSKEVLREMQEEALRQRIVIREEAERIRNEARENHTAIVRERISEIKDRVPEDLQQRIEDRAEIVAQRMQNGRATSVVRGE